MGTFHALRALIDIKFRGKRSFQDICFNVRDIRKTLRFRLPNASIPLFIDDSIRSFCRNRRLIFTGRLSDRFRGELRVMQNERQHYAPHEIHYRAQRGLERQCERRARL